jgi:peroxiredoxin
MAEAATGNRTLIALFVLFAAVLYGLIFGFDCGQKGVMSLSGERAMAADFSLPDMSGKQVSLSDFRGKIVFLNVWATWCAPCRQEMPEIQSLFRKMDPDTFAVLTVSVDQGGREDVANFFRKTQIEVPVLLDQQGKISPLYGVTGYPETFLIDKKGRLVERFIGPRNWTSKELIERYRQLISE